MARRRRNPEIIAGRVNADGSIAAGDGFSVQRTAVGTYTLTFASGFRLVSVTANIASLSGRIASTGSYTDRSCQVLLYQVSAALLDEPFSFTAVGVQQ